jgi:hypothetical protein
MLPVKIQVSTLMSSPTSRILRTVLAAGLLITASAAQSSEIQTATDEAVDADCAFKGT